MKRNVLKAFSLLLALSMLIIPVNAVSESAPFNDLFSVTSASVELVGNNPGTIEVSIVCNADITLYAFEGTWDVEVNENIKLKDITSEVLVFDEDAFNFADASTGEVIWVDLSAYETTLTAGTTILTATYDVAAGTPAGDYTVSCFLGEVVAYSTDAPIETQETLETTITVSHHYDKAVTAPTCTAEGYTTYTCSVCGDTYVADKVAATGHDMQETTAAVEPGCETAGSTAIFTCANGCGKTEGGDAIDATDHTWGDPVYTDTDGDTHTATWTCENDGSHTKSETGKHTYTDGVCVCGAEEPVIDVSVIYKGDALASAYEVAGNVVTVTFDKACKVGYFDATSGAYVAITAVANADGSYSFTAPEGVTEVLLVVKGDVNGDGKITNSDKTRLNAAVLEKTTLTVEALFAADVNGDEKISNSDKTRLNAVILEKTTLTW